MGLRNGSLVCDYCSNTVFTFEPFQIAWTAKDSSDPKAGFSYTTQTWQEIDDGENKGCNWCDILWGEIPFWYQHRKKKETPMPEETFKITVRFEKRNSEDDIVLKVMVEDDWSPRYQVRCDPDENAAAFVPGRKLVWQIASPRAFRLALDCLAQCTLRHDCPKSQETSLPTRVIDCSDPERPKLVLTEGMQGFYAALSYVWGEPQPHSVCTTKLSTYLESIDILLLPKTIRDAIFCTYSLNLRYLWADTLCILQDSEEDKQREIPQMCDIYRCAYVTIIAASSQKVSEGFLHNRKKPVETLLPFWCPDGKLGTISVDEGDGNARSSQEPVNRRAWCFQERLLSPRTLVYASHTLQYQCQTAMNEIGDIWNYLPSTELGELRLPCMMISRTPCRTLSSNDVEALLTAWQNVLYDYTRRAVSHPSDRLVAISGIAQLSSVGGEVAIVTSLGYGNAICPLTSCGTEIAHPTEVLLQGNFLHHRGLGLPPLDASLPDGTKKVGNVIWDVQSCDAIPVSDNHPLGQVKGGRLIVRAIVRDVTWDPAEPELFELKRPCVSVAKTGDEPEERDGACSLSVRSLPTSAARVVHTTVDTELAVKDSDQIKITTLPGRNAKLSSASPVEHVDIRMCDAEQVKKGWKLVNICHSFITNLFLKLVPCLVRRKNAHTTETAPARRPATSRQVTSNDTNGNEAEAMTPQDHSTNTEMVVASTEAIEIGRGGEPDHIGLNNHAKRRQSNEVTVPSKERERHIGYGYFDYDSAGIGADKGKAVVVSSDKGEDPGHLMGLIVVPAGSAGEFRRVGIFHVDGRFYEDEEAPYCDIKSWLNTLTEVITII